MSNSCVRLVVTLLVFALAGCASVGGFPERPESASKKLDELRKQFFLPGKNVLKEFDEEEDPVKKRQYRDRVVYGRLLAIDMQFGLFKEAIYEEGIFTNLSTDILGVAVGAAGAVTTGADASRILSALSGGISGTGTAINKNLYYERTLPALIALMDANREKIRAEILKGLIRSVEVYPLGSALADLERYFQAGSIPGAVASVTATAGETKANFEKEIATVRDRTFAIDELLNLADKLENDDALDLLCRPPSKIDLYTLNAVKSRLDGKDLCSSESEAILKTDSRAKEVLKMILVLMSDRSKENTKIWKAAISVRLGL